MTHSTFWRSHISRQDGYWFLWMPVFLGLGIGGYFALPMEPSVWLVTAFSGGLVALAVALAVKWRIGVLAAMVGMVGLGGAAAKLRTEMVRAPVIKAPGSYKLEGRLDKVLQLHGDRRQLILSQLKIAGLAEGATPFRVRLHSRQPLDSTVLPGAMVGVRAVLRPPPGPVRPDGFDFARKAWFERLGAVGFTIAPLEAIEHAPLSSALGARIERLRLKIYRLVKSVLPATGGDIVAALLLGEKKGLSEPVLEAIRTAGLAHMLAISGLHMALFAGSLYWLLRALGALSQRAALLFDLRKPAALAAIAAAGFYYLLSGTGIATFRAFIMITIMLGAVLLGRTAISLRNVAVAALAILLLMPESLLDVGFQMSFAAVVALVAGYEYLTARRRAAAAAGAARRENGAVGWVSRKMAAGLLGIGMTTLIAGIAVLPYGVFHFHHMSTYSLLGNLLAMPILTLWVMPLALASLIAMPFGWQELPLLLMGRGSEAILWVAEQVAELASARVITGAIGFDALLLMTFGGLWLCLWRSPARLIGLPVMGLGGLLAGWQPQPDFLIGRDGKNVVLFDEQRVMRVAYDGRSRYSLDRWRRAYGGWNENTQPQEKAVAAKGWRCDIHGCSAASGRVRLVISQHPSSLAEDCNRSDILVATYPLAKRLAHCRRPGHRIDILALKRKGAHALYITREGVRVVSSASKRGRRPWTAGP